MSAIDNVNAVAGRAERLLQRLFGDAAPGTVFSAPQPMGDDVVITAAAWERAGGFGFGGGSGRDDEGGGGAGGGGVSQGRPVAVIRITRSRVEVTPLLDLTKVAVTVVLAAVGVRRALR